MPEQVEEMRRAGGLWYGYARDDDERLVEVIVDEHIMRVMLDISRTPVPEPSAPHNKPYEELDPAWWLEDTWPTPLPGWDDGAHYSIVAGEDFLVVVARGDKGHGGFLHFFRVVQEIPESYYTLVREDRRETISA